MFSKTTEYALRAALYVAKEGKDGRKISIDEIAEAIGSPRHFTAKVLQALSRDGRVIDSERGPGGGFFLARGSGQLPVSILLEAMGEMKVLTGCVLGLPNCSAERPCAMHHKYEGIKKQLLHLFETTTVESLSEETDVETFFKH
ncbi:MAG: Rrf2 family transcriptional regulator [Chitinophagaceae bacterium]|nr:Rrf2 family transcriptional regulator [Chitinophagaceae bacterium]